MNFEKYDPKLKELARKLRNNGTRVEVMLWNRLKKKQVLGQDFHRQKPLGSYIADFYCPEARLVIEVDGRSHLNNGAVVRDREKDEYLKKRDLSVLRLRNEDVLNDIGNVLKRIESIIVSKIHTPRSPL